MFGRKKSDGDPAGELGDKVVTWRRHLHAHPELSYEEHDTTAYIAEQLTQLGLEPKTFDLGTGLWCDVEPAKGAGSSDRVGLRADIDALPMEERSGLDFASTVEDVAHTCGHDGHTAMLLGAATLLVADPPPRPVRLIFQPAEETMPGGALDCVEEGVVEGVDRVFALHCDPKRRTGEVGVTSGGVTSSNAKVRITVSGDGGHTARPHETQDVVYALSTIATGLAGILDRRIDPRTGTVLTWGAISAGGDAPNVIPSSGSLLGTLRSADREVWAMAEELVREAVDQLAAPFGIDVEVEYTQGVPPVVNDPDCAEICERAVTDVLGDDGVGPAEQSSGGEDFGWYTEEIPGAYLRLGVWDGDGPKTDLHHPGFQLDEAALEPGARLLDALARLDRAGDSSD